MPGDYTACHYTGTVFLNNRLMVVRDGFKSFENACMIRHLTIIASTFHITIWKEFCC